MSLGPQQFLNQRPALSIRPSPVGRLGFIDTVLMRVVPAFDPLIQESLLRMSPNLLQFRDTIYDIHRKTEAIDVVINGQFQGSVDAALFFISAYVNVGMIRAPISQPVNQLRVAVKIEHQDRKSTRLNS